MPRKRRSYKVGFKRQVLEALRNATTRQVEEEFDVPRRNVRDWAGNAEAIRGFSGSVRRRSFTTGRKEKLPFAGHLLTFMKDQRREEKVRIIMLFISESP